MTDEANQGTEVKTMWSESLLEGLYDALKKQKGDRVLVGIIRELKAKGYDSRYLIDKVSKKIGPKAGDRMRELLSRGARKAPRRRKPGKPPAQQGLIARIMSLFKR